MKVIPYKDKFYIQVTPVKRLFNSTTVHEVVTRGDIFAVDIASKELTVLPRSALEGIVEMEITQLVSPPQIFSKFPTKFNIEVYGSYKPSGSFSHRYRLPVVSSEVSEELVRINVALPY